MRHASLFSGIGGFDLAAKWMGWENVFNCEIDPFCRKVLKYHFSNTIQYGDITKTDFTKYRGKVDILTGGFPCQPFSVAGSRKGKHDDRYLWPEMLRVIREIRPAWIIGENVAGITSMVQPGSETEVESQASLFEEDNTQTIYEQEFVIETICSDLEREGYSVQPVVIPACAVGAPHRRDRIWFIANRSNARVEGVRESEIDTNGYEFTTYSDNQRLQRIPKDGVLRKGEKKQQDGQLIGIFRTYWQDFPTVAPVYNGDDGISGRLDSITFSKWRSESIKAGGNAIVPQVAYEIFKAIEEVENSIKLKKNR